VWQSKRQLLPVVQNKKTLDEAYIMAFIKWYLNQLRSFPIRSNLAASLVLMTIGDVMAQSLERHSMYQPGENQGKGTLQRRHTLHRYGTHTKLILNQYKINIESTYDDEEMKQKATPEAKSNAGLYLAPLSSMNDTYRSLYEKFSSVDFFRLATMVTWNVAFVTPAFLGLYHVSDRIFGHAPTLRVVSGRVLLALFFSIPVNTLFFIYGTCIHHSAERLSLRRDLIQALQAKVGESGEEAPNLTQKNNIVETLVPWNWDLMFKKARRKIDADLLDTIIRSASLWVPINFFNFAVMPPHLRPLTMMFFSVFWNCYLSIVQHRDLNDQIKGE
jgi:Mpv17 / PMP22 family